MPSKKLKVKNVKKNTRSSVKITSNAPVGDSHLLATELASGSNIRLSRKSKSPPSAKTFATPRSSNSSASGLPSRTKKSKAIKVDVYDTKGKVVEEMDLPGDVFGAKINEKLLAQAIRVYLANQRRGTASTKSRGEVKGSSRKIYRQKGTGRARHGSIRAPIFVHGGVAFGPTPRDFSLKLPRKMKKAALFSALSSKVKNNEIKIVAGLGKITPKTKEMANVIKNLELTGKKTLLILPKKEENIYRAARNLENVDIALVPSLNAYSVLQGKVLLFMREAIDKLGKLD